jgi:hypothetical protein
VIMVDHRVIIKQNDVPFYPLFASIAVNTGMSR